MTLIGPRRLFEKEMRQYRDPEAAARALMPSDDQFLYRSIGLVVAAVVSVIAGFYALSLADGHDDADDGVSATEVRAATEGLAREIDGTERLALDFGYSAVDIETMLINAGKPALEADGTDAGFTITNAEGEYPVCLSIDRLAAAEPDWVELSASVRAGSC
ncbi:hypothetical protein [Streptomyces sp. 4N124]|uniref:hypothetical protein n=1 Tax=Streptomyces sp. 4N124 TaxID=3457420 RepID=UPI003FD3C16C